MNKHLQTINSDLEAIVSKYKENNLIDLMRLHNINPESKGKMRTLTKRILIDYDSKALLSFLSDGNVQVKTVKLVRGGSVEASLSMPSFDFCKIAKEDWVNSELRRMLLDTTFILFFYEVPPYKNDVLYLRAAFAWKMPLDMLDNGVKECWQIVSDSVKEGKIVKYIDENGRHHTYFPRTADNPYIHVRPHAASTDSTLPLPKPDILTGLQKYPMHSFWINRLLIQKLYKQYMGADNR